MKPKCDLYNWKIIDEYGYYHLIGSCPNHPKLGNTKVSTSSLLKINFKTMIAETRNTIYKLRG